MTYFYYVTINNYVIYLFDVATFFDDVSITLYFGLFELRTEITLKNGHFFIFQQKMNKKNVFIT